MSQKHLVHLRWWKTVKKTMQLHKHLIKYHLVYHVTVSLTKKVRSSTQHRMLLLTKHPDEDNDH